MWQSLCNFRQRCAELANWQILHRSMLLCIVSAGLFVSTAAAQTYQFKHVHVPENLGTWPRVHGAALGSLMGRFLNPDGAIRHWLYSRTTNQFSVIHHPLFPEIEFTALNQSHHMSCWWNDPAVGTRACIRISGRVKPLKATGYPWSAAFGLNRLDRVAGMTYDFLQSHGVVWNVKNGKVKIIDVPGALHTVLADINNFDTVVGAYFTTGFGTAGVRLKQGVYTMHVAPDTGGITELVGINDADEMVARWSTEDGQLKSYVVSPDGQTWTELLHPESTGQTVVMGIRNGGIAYGYYSDANGADAGFVAEPVLNLAAQ